MAVGKNKQNIKPGKKGGKKKVIDPFTRKEWYDVKAPSMFKVRKIGKTLVNRTQGTRLASDGLKGRVYEVSLADLQDDNDGERSFRKFKLICEDVHGKNCLTNFHGMLLTTDKLKSMVKKWQTLIEAHVDVKTSDGYILRLFCIAFSTKNQNSHKKTAYAQQSKQEKIRSRMRQVMQKEVSGQPLRDVINKLIPDSIAKDVEKNCQGIYPLHDVHIRKVKVLRKPKFDPAKLVEMHKEVANPKDVTAPGGGEEEKGEIVSRPDGYEPPVLDSV